MEGDARAAARALAERLGGRYVEHERFETATVRRRRPPSRRPRPHPHGALPDCRVRCRWSRRRSLKEDLRRRDFTINAMAAALKGDELGRLHDPENGRARPRARA